MAPSLRHWRPGEECLLLGTQKGELCGQDPVGATVWRPPVSEAVPTTSTYCDSMHESVVSRVLRPLLSIERKRPVHATHGWASGIPQTEGAAFASICIQRRFRREPTG